MMRRDEMVGSKGNFTGMVSKGYLMCFTTSMSKADFSVWGTKQRSFSDLEKMGPTLE